MRPLFTVHAGELLVGSEIERRIRHAAVWVPPKDTGIDLLVTSKRTDRPGSLHVKCSRDCSMHEPGFVAFGWWTLDREMIRESKADFWVFVLLPLEPKRSLGRKNIEYVIIPPKELAGRLGRIHGRTKRVDSYLGVTAKKRCWEGRGLRGSDKALIAVGQDGHIEKDRDFTPYLNAWQLLTRVLQRR